MRGRVFISYSSADRAWVDRLAAALDVAGWDAFVDHQSISGGTEWRTSIVRGLKTADAFLLVLSPTSVTSKNVVKELSLAEEFERRIIPIQKAPAEEGSDFKYQLAGLHRISFVDVPWRDAIDRLVDALLAADTGTVEAPSLTEGTFPGNRPPPKPKPKPKAKGAKKGKKGKKGKSSPLPGLLLLVAVIGAGAFFLLNQPADSPPPPATTPAATPQARIEEAPKAAPEPSAQPATSRVSRLVVAHEVIDSEPKRKKRAFRVGQKVYAFTEVHSDAATTVSHRYSREGKVAHTSELNVKAGRYRTWSYVTAREPGPWTVAVLDSRGRQLATEAFTVRK